MAYADREVAHKYEDGTPREHAMAQQIAEDMEYIERLERAVLASWFHEWQALGDEYERCSVCGVMIWQSYELETRRDHTADCIVPALLAKYT